MFNTRTKSSASIELGGNATTVIGLGTTINGNIQSNGDIRVDGTIKGNVTSSAKILVGADGKIDGNLNGKQANIVGKVNGNLNIIELLHLQGKSTVVGDIYAGKLQVDPAASFNGKCHMGANVVELGKERNMTAVNE